MFYNGFKEIVGIWLFFLFLPLNFVSAKNSDSLYTLKSNLDFNIATGGARDIELDNNFMYVLTSSGVRVYDISDVSNPMFLSGLDMEVDDIEVKNGILYASYYITGELFAVDYSDPTHPLRYDPVQVGGDAADVEIEGDRIYVARRFDGIGILDISNPISPILEYEIPAHSNGYFYDLDVEGDYLYVADNRRYTESLHIYDLDHFNLISSFMHTEGSGSRIRVSGDLAFLWADLEGVQIIDVSNKERPTYKSKFDFDDCINDIEANDAVAYLAYCRNGFVILDASDPLSPEMIGNFGSGWYNDIELLDNTCFLAKGSFGVKVIDVSTASSITELGEIETYGSAKNFDLKDNFAFIANERMGLYVVDMSDPANLKLSDIIESQGAFSDVEIKDHYAYVVDNEIGLLIFDISDPQEIFLVSSLSLDESPDEIAINRSRAYVTYFSSSISSSGIWVVDISDPLEPYLLTNIRNRFARNLIADGNILYYAVFGDGFNIIDVTDIHQPTVLGTIDLPIPIEGGGISLAIEGNFAYLAHSVGFGDLAWLMIIDISNRVYPFIIYEMTLEVGCDSYDLDLVVEDSIVYMSEREGVQIFDVTEKTNPVFVGKFQTRGTPYSLKMKDENIYIAEGNEGFSIYEPVELPFKGDVNSDGVVDALDVIKVVHHIIGLQLLKGEMFIRADCNSDGQITVLDVVGIVRAILGIEECSP
ncbi:MAG: hypothetical protein JSV84_05940 [Gemmatimonadota bacterium]|nr:MAG: hypothetical protein JSV84_05940 [Gemmatimonadota bacterium]